LRYYSLKGFLTSQSSLYNIDFSLYFHIFYKSELRGIRRVYIAFIRAYFTTNEGVSHFAIRGDCYKKYDYDNDSYSLKRARYIVRDYSFREQQLYISDFHHHKCVALYIFILIIKALHVS
jgi:hypothetical protein